MEDVIDTVFGYDSAGVAAVGINCTKPRYLQGLVRALDVGLRKFNLTRKPKLVYLIFAQFLKIIAKQLTRLYNLTVACLTLLRHVDGNCLAVQMILSRWKNGLGLSLMLQLLS